MASHNRFAIVGLACRLPGGSNSPIDYFCNLQRGKDCISEIPPDRFCAAYYNRLHKDHPARIVSHRGGLMDHFFDFDNKAFQISKKEALVQDVQQKILLETSLEALEDSNVAYRGTNMGVFVGSCGTGIIKHNIEQPYYVNEYTATGTALSIHANLLSYKFDLRGPSTHVDTACSASGYAMFSALAAIDAGHCDSALVAGINIMLDHCMMIAFGRLGVLNTPGMCKSFDADADGFVRSEGCGVVVVKKLEDALRDGDKIYSIIRSTTANADGGLSQSLTTPSAEAQSLTLQTALDRASVKPEEVFFLEAHATGTKVGDPIELNGSGRVLGKPRFGLSGTQTLRIGSVKSNIGHTECTAYISSLIKCCLMLRYGMLVPNINFRTPHPDIKFEEYRMKVQLEVESFDPEGKFFVVSSFGFGGANICTVLEGVKRNFDVFARRTVEYCLRAPEEEGKDSNPQVEKEGEGEVVASTSATVSLPAPAASSAASLFAEEDKSESRGVVGSPFSFFLYGRTKEGAMRRVEQFKPFSRSVVGSSPEAQARLSYTLNTARQAHYSHVCVGIGKSLHEANWGDPLRLEVPSDSQISLLPEAERPKLMPGHHRHVVFVFSGQGPQNLEMGRTLYRRFKVFRDAIDECDKYYTRLSGVSLKNDLGLFAGDEAKITKPILDKIENTLPALVSVQLALIRLWDSFGVVPSAVVGHSFGELAASYACGAVKSIETVLNIAYSRVKIVSEMKAVGKMIAVGTSGGEALEMVRAMGLDGRIWVAANNSPLMVTLGVHRVGHDLLLPHDAPNGNRLSYESTVIHGPNIDGVSSEALRTEHSSIGLTVAVPGNVVGLIGIAQRRRDRGKQNRKIEVVGPKPPNEVHCSFSLRLDNNIVVVFRHHRRTFVPENHSEMEDAPNLRKPLLTKIGVHPFHSRPISNVTFCNMHTHPRHGIELPKPAVLVLRSSGTT